MKLEQLLEMPQYTAHNLGDDPADDHTPMDVFTMTVEQFQKRYAIVGTRKDNNAVAGLAHDKSGALVGIYKQRENDGVPAVEIYGELHFKNELNIGREIAGDTSRLLQVSLVNVVKKEGFRGLASFLYASIVRAGFAIVSDTHHYEGGKELWMKLGRSHAPDEAIFVMNRGHLMTDASGRPLEYDGRNIPEDQLWSKDERNKYVLFVYRRK